MKPEKIKPIPSIIKNIPKGKKSIQTRALIM